jgi:hypothetical protein
VDERILSDRQKPNPGIRTVSGHGEEIKAHTPSAAPLLTAPEE